ncbi:hypothetical protein IPG41_04620 [Candidatus Peregrinibacteria bacterium]|nr:MAG: hypothetical protein IPG41_04620 [Candidatus Peregrinibacteria bacterium]
MYFLLFILSLGLLVKSAERAICYSNTIAKSFNFSRFVMGFFVIAFISILPETLISLISAAKGTPEFGMGTLLGSNVADLTVVFFFVILASKKGLKVSDVVFRKNIYCLPLFALPIVLGFDFEYSRLDGFALLGAGVAYYVWALHHDLPKDQARIASSFHWGTLLLLLVSMGVLLLSASLTVKFGTLTAEQWGVHPILVGLLFVGLGTTLPELFFSVQAVRKHYNGLAIGDILGTVISDATMVLGLTILVSPFDFAPSLIWVTGGFMFFAALLLFVLMKTDRELSRWEGFLLLGLYFAFVACEFWANH